MRGVKRGSRAFYQLREDENINKLSLNMIPTPEEMGKRLQKLESEQSEHK